MKLRVRFGGRRELLDLPDSAVSLQDVAEEVGRLLDLEPISFIVSLNGSTPLTEDTSVLLSELGIVGGDLLHIIQCGTAAPDSSSQAARVTPYPTPSTSGTSDTSNVTETSSKKLRAGNTTSKSNDKRVRSGYKQDTDSSVSSEEISSVKHKKTSSSNVTDTSVSGQEQARADSSGAGLVMKRPSALLCRDGVSYMLQQTYEQSDVSTLHEAVCIAVHVLMLETGFALIVDKAEQAPVQEDETQSNQLIVHNWRTNQGAEFQYSHPTCPNYSCLVVCSSLGPYVLAHGVTQGNEVHQCQIAAADYVRGNVELKTHGAAEIFHNLGRLSRMVKDQIAYPLLSSMRHELDLPELYGFIALPSEVKIMVLSLLPVKSIVIMSSLCQELHSVANDNSLWHHLCFRDFAVTSCYKLLQAVTSWKAEYIRIYKELKAMRTYSPTYVTPEWMSGIGSAPNVNPFAEIGPPGIIGGRHDLYPNLPFMPGGFHPPGHAPGPGVLPRPRFDPFGPIPDIDQPGPSRHPHGHGRGRGRRPFGGFPPGPMF